MSVCQTCGNSLRERSDRKVKFCSSKCWGASKINVAAEMLARSSNRDPKTGCHIWTGYTARGYGRFTIGQKQVLAHRAAFELAKGKIPPGLLICHTCDNPLCVNPDHLFAGSPRDNSLDMARKGRSLQGIKHHKAKLTESQVLAIRTFLGPSKSAAALFGVSASTVKRIKNLQSWRHI